MKRTYSQKQQLSKTFDKHIESHSDTTSVTKQALHFFFNISIIAFIVENCLKCFFPSSCFSLTSFITISTSLLLVVLVVLILFHFECHAFGT